MANNGRNGAFLVSPAGNQRDGKTKNADSVVIPNFAPVVADGTPDEMGIQGFKLATSSVAFQRGIHGIAIYEGDPWVPERGFDARVGTLQDVDHAPVGAWMTVQSGQPIKVRLVNTEDEDFGASTYKGRVMVAGLGSTPSISAGDGLGPNTTPSDSAGYWEQDNTNPWLIVTKVDPSGSFIEAVAV